jgi:acetate kinase
MDRPVLVVNSGSSSMKYQLVDPDAGVAVAAGIVERIGSSGTASATHTVAGNRQTFTGPIPDHAAALEVMQRLFAESGRPLRGERLVGVGHRVVHGGDVFSDPVIIDDAVLEQVRAVSVLAPLHNPANITGIEQAARAFPGIPQVAVFDTAFFRTLPPAAAQYAIDAHLAAQHGIRRYGFHGTSHEYVSGQVATVLGRPLDELDQIVLHLGNGASASAVRGGVAVETSMGLTPLEGLVMGTRSGDLDPGVLLHLTGQVGLTLAELDTLLNRRSGLLGLAGTNDFRDLQEMVDGADPERAAAARLAVDVFCWAARTSSPSRPGWGRTRRRCARRSWPAWNAWASRSTRAATPPAAPRRGSSHRRTPRSP